MTLTRVGHTAAILVLAILLGACTTNGSDTNASNRSGTENSNVKNETTSQTANGGTPSTDDGTFNGLPVPALPIIGDFDETDQPEPPPLHAVFSVVVRYETSWAPYYGADMIDFDETGVASMVAQLAQIDAALATYDIPASFELAYGPANLLCMAHPDLLKTLVSHGHSIGVNARTNGEVFRATEALSACDITPQTLSGLAQMADPPGPSEATTASLANAISIASINDFGQVTGVVSPTCEALALASPTNRYGAGAFTAPWRSGWTDSNACSDKRSGSVVVIDQVALAPDADESRITPGQYANVERFLTQALGWAADHRYREPSELPAPGIFSWGLTVRLADLVDTPVSDEEQSQNEPDSTTTTTLVADMPTPAAPHPPTRLNTDALNSLSELLTGFEPQVESGELAWVPPGWIGATLRADGANVPVPQG